MYPLISTTATKAFRRKCCRRRGTCDVVGDEVQYAQMDSVILSGIFRDYIWGVQEAKRDVEGLAAAATGDSRETLEVSGKGLLYISMTRDSRKVELAGVPGWNGCGTLAIVS